MRTIEKEMLKAIQDGINWQKSNTGVFFDNNNTKYGPRSEVYLFGNHIGDYWHNTKEFEVDEQTLSEWPSVTTISRLRALDVNLTVKKGKIYIDGEFITSKE